MELIPGPGCQAGSMPKRAISALSSPVAGGWPPAHAESSWRLAGGPDEHLDQATAETLMTDLLSATAGRTVLLITHRLPRDAAVDEVFRLEDGRLAPVPPAGLSPLC